MTNFFKKISRLVLADDPMTSSLKLTRKERKFSNLTPRQLIQKESEYAQGIFGQVSSNIVRREFFNLDEKTWIWHEEIRDQAGDTHEVTTRYELQPRGILKIQPGPRYSYISGGELDNFYRAVRAYYERVSIGLYRVDPKTGASL